MFRLKDCITLRIRFQNLTVAADSDSGKRRRRRRCKIFSLKNISLINSREKISLCATSFTFH